MISCAAVFDFTLDDFDYTLPPELIAQTPAARRDASRLLLLTDSGIQHQQFADLVGLVHKKVGPGALVVLNDTRVIPARLRAHRRPRNPKSETPGGRVELLLCDPLETNNQAGRWTERWRCLYRASKPLRPSDELILLPHSQGARIPSAVVQENEGGGHVQVSFSDSAEGSEGLLAVLPALGEVPLPPYIERQQGSLPDDLERYQTVFATQPGAVAAPTAGLHFTPEVLVALAEQTGTPPLTITLHVGHGTFAPVKDGDLAAHVMHKERYHIPAQTAAAINAAKAAGRPVLAVGTTVLRALESAFDPQSHSLRSGPGETALFIYPPYRFRVVSALLTNFHLPRSTLLMLVSALAGRRRILSAYNAAVAAGYRFFSYGDAMLIPRIMEDLAS